MIAQVRTRIALRLAAAVAAATLCAAAYAVTANRAPPPPPAPPAAPAAPAAPAVPTAPVSGLAGAVPLPAAQQYQLGGQIAERLAAGPYSYLRLRGDAGRDDTWIVLSGDDAQRATGERIDVRVMARAERFRSRRLDREFDILLFASLIRSSH